MTSHLSSSHLPASMLNALADGELSADQLTLANEHLAVCPACTTRALQQSLLKASTARAGQRYAPPPQLRKQLERILAEEKLQKTKQEFAAGMKPSRPGTGPATVMLGWAAAAVLLIAFIGISLLQRNAHRTDAAVEARAALTTEVFDQHVATLAASLPPQVVSTDRHTVKPWFQGKIPFSFNLPENLPKDVTLEGANLNYLHNQPTAQLLYSIGRHRVSIFVCEKPSAGAAQQNLLIEHSGFHVIDTSSSDLELVAISDVDPARLADLVNLLRQAQTDNRPQPR
jgi:anti-sigma factor RsiW